MGPWSAGALEAITADVLKTEATRAEADLLASLIALLAELDGADPADRGRIRSVVTTLTEGMEMDLSSFPPGEPGKVAALADAAALDRYTYLVAGCVGAFWTQMCAAHTPALSGWDIDAMSETGVRFGKALQLTNVLRDVPADLREGRCYLPLDRLGELGLAPADLLDPDNSERALPALAEWIQVALGHYGEAQRYVLAIPGGQRRLRLAALWPVLMGLETLAILARRRRWLTGGARARVSRRWVYSMMGRSALVCSSDRAVGRWMAGLAARVAAAI